MKNITKIFSLLLLATCFIACNENDDMKYDPTTDMGWVQFVEASEGGVSTYTTTQVRNEVVKVPVNIQVPSTSSDLTINYDLVSVSGMDPNSIFGSSIVVPAGVTSYSGPDNNTGIEYGHLPTIDFNVALITAPLTEPMIFDVVLTGTSSSDIVAGLAGEGFPLTTRVQICPSLFDSATGNYLGDYILTVPSGPGSFGNVFDDGITVTLIEGPSGSLSRQFDAQYLPAFSATFETITFEFDNGFAVTGDVATGIGCASEIILTGDVANAATPCTEDEIVLNMLDFYQGTGDCGVADEAVTVVLTKV